MNRQVTLFHSPQTRSFGVLALLEELGAEHELNVLDVKAGQQRRPDYLAVNPMGKVPAIRHGGALVTEQAAIYMYLAEMYPEAGLSPAVGDPLRGPYLRWMTFYGSCFEPALIDKALKREAASPSMAPYGDFDTMLKTLTDQLEPGPYLLGDKMTAADMLWAIALGWTTSFKLVPETPRIRAYIELIEARPAVARARARDAAILAARPQ